MTTISWQLSRCRVVGAMTTVADEAAFTAAPAVVACDDGVELRALRSLTIDGGVQGEVAAPELRLEPVVVDRMVEVWVFRAPPRDGIWWEDAAEELAATGALIDRAAHPEVQALVCVVDPARAGELREAWAEEFGEQARSATRQAADEHARAVALRLARRAVCLATRHAAHDAATLVLALRLAGRSDEAEAVLANAQEMGFVEDLRGSLALLVGERETQQAALGLEGRQIRERIRGALFERNHENLRYQIREKLGAGGMGVVYRAFDPILACEVALKQLPAQHAGDNALIEQLRREAQMMAQLRGKPNVVTLFDFFAEADTVFVVMELIEGFNLREWQGRRTRGWSETLEMYLQAAHGLQVAHTAGLVHRDFKPENVMVARDGVAKVADFGLAYTPAATGEAVAVAGTLYYMAPEQLLCLEAGPASDQFSFCVALYEALFERHPMLKPGSREPTVAYRGTRSLNVATDHPLALAIRGGTMQTPDRGPVPKHVVEALRRGMSLKREDRFASMDALAAALRGRPARNRMFAVGTALVAATVATMLLLRPAPPSPPLLPTKEELVEASHGEIAGLDIPELRERFASDKATATLLDRLAIMADRWGTLDGELRFASQEAASTETSSRLACLALARTGYVGFVTALRASGELHPIGAAELFDSLTSPEECERLPEWSLRCRVDEANEQTSVHATAIISGMKAANERELAGDFVGATQQATTAASIAEMRELPMLATRSRLLEGRLRQLSEQPAEAMTALQAAYDHIETRSCVDLRADIASRIVKVVARNPSIPREYGDVWVRTAKSLARHTDDRGWRASVAHNDSGLFLQQRYHDSENALAELRQALELRGRSGLDGPSSEQADTYLNLGNVNVSLGRSSDAREAYQRARAARAAVYGVGHPLLHRELYGMGVWEREWGDLESSLSLLVEAEAMAISGYGANSGPRVASLAEQAKTLMFLDRREEAARKAVLAVASAAQAPMDPVLRIEEEADAGALIAVAGDPRRSIELFEKAAQATVGQPWRGEVFAMLYENLAIAHNSIRLSTKGNESKAAEKAASEAISAVIGWFDAGAEVVDRTIVDALILRGELRLGRGDAAGAVEDYTRVFAEPLAKWGPAGWGRARVGFGQALQMRGRKGDRERSCEQLSAIEASTASERAGLEDLVDELRRGCRGPGRKNAGR